MEKLRSIGVNTSILEKNCPVEIVQRHYDPNGEGKSVMLPVFRVEWRSPSSAEPGSRARVTASAAVFGATRQLIEYHVMDKSLFLGPPLAIVDPEKLLMISDREFETLTDVGRSNMLLLHSVRLPTQGGISNAATSASP